jgi:hypothetical protein
MVIVSHGFPVDQMGGDDDSSRNGYDDYACFFLKKKVANDQDRESDGEQ